MTSIKKYKTFVFQINKKDISYEKLSLNSFYNYQDRFELN